MYEWIGFFLISPSFHRSRFTSLEYCVILSTHTGVPVWSTVCYTPPSLEYQFEVMCATSHPPWSTSLEYCVLHSTLPGVPFWSNVCYFPPTLEYQFVVLCATVHPPWITSLEYCVLLSTHHGVFDWSTVCYCPPTLDYQFEERHIEKYSQLFSQRVWLPLQMTIKVSVYISWVVLYNIDVCVVCVCMICIVWKNLCFFPPI